MTGSSPARLRAAYVRRTHGVHGEVRAEPCGGDAGRFAAGTSLRVESTGQALRIRSARDGGGGSVLLAFDAIDTAEAAAMLRGQYLDVDASSARPLGSDEWFTWQLIGLTVRDHDGRALGVVEDVEEAVASDVLVVSGDGRQHRYPMVREFVKRVDLDSGVITLEPQPEIDA